MDEYILKYFTNNLEEEMTTKMPQNVDTGITDNFLNDLRTYYKTITTNDGNYYIRYGGYPRIDLADVGGIDVMTLNSIKNSETIYSFYGMKINGHGFCLRDLHQDENGRFYGVANYIDANLIYESYLIIFNNFVQDGYIKIRKYYTNIDMGMPTDIALSNVIKRKDYGEYFFSMNDKIYRFKIDINEGNSLSTINTNIGLSNLKIIDNNLFLMQTSKTINNNDIITQIQNKKVVINLENEFTGTKNATTVNIINKANNIIIDSEIHNYKYYEALLINNGENYVFTFNIVDLNGGKKTFNSNDVFTGNEQLVIAFSENYVALGDNTNNILYLYYYDITDNSIIKFSTINDFYGYMVDVQVLKQFNIEILIGLNTKTSLVYAQNINSKGYSSSPYINKNFMIPQYLNLYSEENSNINDNTSLIYSRDAINRFLAGNQLTATFNVPNYLLNNSLIKTERLEGQTNIGILNKIREISKNRFESLYLSYIFNISIIDDTNGYYQKNSIGSNRLCNSIWNSLDMTKSSCIKARITKEDLTQEIIDLDTTNISGNICTIEYEVTGNIQKIEYISNDLKTVYATYRCNLTGTNTITQTIEIS